MVQPRPRALALCVTLAFMTLFSASLSAAEFYVSPGASSSGNGSYGNPWKLQTALNHPSAVHAGDTIWLRGGTYTGTYTSLLTGTSSQPIVVRQYPGERATLDGGNSGGVQILTIQGKYTWFWGFEIMSSDPNRQSSQISPWPSDIGRGPGFGFVQAAGMGVGTKLINLVVHDTRGSGLTPEALDAEVYGCLLYYNGWQAPDRGHGHALYVQNQTGTKKIVDNIMFQQFSHGFHAYGGTTAYLDNLHVQGNTLYNNGNLATTGNARNLLLGGDRRALNPTVLNNYLYYQHALSPETAFDLGYGAGCTNATVTNNYVANNTTFVNCLPVSMTGNTFYGTIAGFSQGAYPSNSYFSSRPTGTKVFVRPNQYESGRAHITVFNWALAASVGVDLSSFLPAGTGFEIRNANDFFGAPVASGVYGGGSVTIPLTGLSVAAPIGWLAPPPPGPEFNAFVVLPASGGGTPTATPTRTATAPASTATRTPSRTPTRTPICRPPDRHAAGHRHRTADRDADRDAYSDSYRDAHAHAHADIRRGSVPPAPRRRERDAGGAHGQRDRQLGLCGQVHPNDDHELGNRDLDLHGAVLGDLLRVGPGQVAQRHHRLLLRRHGFRRRRRLRHRRGHLDSELAVETAERPGWRGAADAQPPDVFTLRGLAHAAVPRA